MIKAALIGAGNRGMFAYASYALDHGDEISFIAVAEPNEEKRKKFAKDHNIPIEMQFESWQDLLGQPQLCEALVICTHDKTHFEPTMKALDQGYDILLEKPMSPDPLETILMAEKVKEVNSGLTICHVLRYSTFFKTLKEIIDQKQVGDIMSITWNENVGIFQYVHSFVRGNKGDTREASSMLLQKSCHDMDLLQWIIDSDCKRVSSFGHLSHFKKENAPESCKGKCTDCETIYNAPDMYTNRIDKWRHISLSSDPKERMKALKNGRFGRCPYHCDNDVVDHQVVNMEFKNQVTVAFTMSAFTNETSRTFKMMGTKGEITGSTAKNELEVQLFSGRKDTITPEKVKGGHNGGDTMIMKDFIRQIKSGKRDDSLTSAEESAKSHLIGFAAEESRLTGKTINVDDYVQSLE